MMPITIEGQRARRQMRADYDQAFARLVSAVNQLQALQDGCRPEQRAVKEAVAQFQNAEAAYRRRRNILTDRMKADQQGARDLTGIERED